MWGEQVKKRVAEIRYPFYPARSVQVPAPLSVNKGAANVDY